jgi:hypothetical protein
MPAPTWRANSAYQSGTNSVTMANPAGIAEGDILVLAIETANDWVALVHATNLTNNGWARVANSNSFPGGTPAAANNTYQDIWWRRVGANANTAVILGDAGDHTLAVCAAFSNCVATGSPWDTGTAAGINVKVSVATAQVNSYAVTTSSANTLILTIINSPQDIAAGRINASPLLLVGGAGSDTELTERCDWGTTSGGGGTIAILTHRKPTAGLTANVRANTTVANTAILWTGALIGLADAIIRPRSQVIII